jgi:hypothetical protein
MPGNFKSYFPGKCSSYGLENKVCWSAFIFHSTKSQENLQIWTNTWSSKKDITVLTAYKNLTT